MDFRIDFNIGHQTITCALSPKTTKELPEDCFRPRSLSLNYDIITSIQETFPFNRIEKLVEGLSNIDSLKLYDIGFRRIVFFDTNEQKIIKEEDLKFRY